MKFDIHPVGQSSVYSTIWKINLQWTFFEQCCNQVDNKYISCSVNLVLSSHGLPNCQMTFDEIALLK